MAAFLDDKVLCQKSPIAVSKEPYHSVKRVLLANEPYYQKSLTAASLL
jgi:hypothetical protein